MKTILLTGGTGFLGSHILNKLADSYNFVLLKRSFSDTKRIENVVKKIKMYDIDTCPLKTVFHDAKINYVLHAATNYGRRGESFYNVFMDNVQFPLQLLQLSIENEVELFINTDTFYTKSNNAYISMLNYSLAKIQLRQWLKALSNKIKVINLRMEHIYGPNDSKDKFIPSLIDQLLKNKYKISLTQGSQKRDFVFVDDVVSAYEQVLINKDQIQNSFSEFEIGTGRLTSIGELVKLVHHIIGSQSKLDFGALPERENEIIESSAETSEIKALGWKSKIFLEEGIKRIING